MIDERTDVAGRPHMRAAAQLDAEPRNGDDAHAVAVLLAEECHRAVTNGVLGASNLGVHRRVAVDVLVDDALDVPCRSSSVSAWK